MGGQRTYRWRLRQVTLVASAILALVFAFGAWSLLHEAAMIRGLTENTRSTLLPTMLERQRAVVKI